MALTVEQMFYGVWCEKHLICRWWCGPCKCSLSSLVLSIAPSLLPFSNPAIGSGEHSGSAPYSRSGAANAFWRIYGSQNVPRGSIFQLRPTFPMTHFASFTQRFRRQWLHGTIVLYKFITSVNTIYANYVGGADVLYNKFNVTSSSPPVNPPRDTDSPYKCVVGMGDSYWRLAQCTERHRVVCQSG